MKDIDAQLAIDSFGKNYNIGMALISIHKIKLPEYKKIAESIIKELDIPLCDVEEIVKTMTKGDGIMELSNYID